MKPWPLVILTGPTAAGKTGLSLSLAKRIGGEIISADSMQVYKKMNIGTAKILPQQMEGIPHHLIDVLMPDEEFNVVLFQKLAKEAMEDIISRGKIPIVVGGTGFYIQALLNDIDFTENDSDPAFRQEMEALARQGQGQLLHDRLSQVDPEAAAQIHPNNIKRVIRALEFYEKTGEKISEHNAAERQKTSPYNSAYLVLTWPRQVLYERINRRVDLMMEHGLESEVRALLSDFTLSPTARAAIGYKELIDTISRGERIEDAVALIKQKSRNYAKRQLTWFRRESDVIWVDKDKFHWDEKEILEYMLSVLKEHDILG